MKTIMITGINGFLGSHLAKRLIPDYNVIGLGNTTDNLYRIKDLPIKVYSSRTDNPEDIFINENIHSVIHTATNYRRNNEPIRNVLETNVVLPTVLFSLCEKYGVYSFLNTDSFINSSKKADYKYLQDYALSKKQALDWLKLQQRHCKLINMLIFHMYGQEDAMSKFVPQMMDKLVKNEEIDLTPGKQTRDFIYIDDVTTAYKTVLSTQLDDKPFHQFDVGTGKSITIKKFVETAKSVLGSKSNLNWGALPYRENEIMKSKAYIEPLKNLGWTPNYEVTEGIQKTMNRLTY